MGRKNWSLEYSISPSNVLLCNKLLGDGFPELHSLKPVFVCSGYLVCPSPLSCGRLPCMGFISGPPFPLGFSQVLAKKSPGRRALKGGLKEKKGIDLVISTPRSTPVRLL